MSTDGDIGRLIARVYDARDLGRAIRSLRRDRGWSQSELAEWLGVHRVTVAKLEHGGSIDLPIALEAVALLGAVLELRARTDDPEASRG